MQAPGKILCVDCLAVIVLIVFTAGLPAQGAGHQGSATPPAEPSPSTLSLLPEPAYTPGTVNLVQWQPLGVGVQYFAQRAEDVGFTTGVSDSGWLSSEGFLFTDLLPGVMYWYRAKARAPGVAAVWRQTSQVDFGTDALDDVSIVAVPGDVVLVDGSVPHIDIVGGLTAASSASATLRANVYRCDESRTLTSIEHYLRLLVTKTLEFVVYESMTTEGPYSRIHGNVTTSGSENGWYGSGPIAVDLSADRFYVIGVACLSSLTMNYNHGASGDISWGTHIGIVREDYPGPDQVSYTPNLNSYYQRVATVRPSGYVPDGRVITLPIDLPAGRNWGEVRFNSSLPADTTITVDVLDGSGANELLSAIASGTTLGGIVVPSIRLRANLASGDPSRTPVLHDWELTMLSSDGGEETGWSAVESSTQCMSCPSDLDGDCDVDVDDLRIFEACSTGPAILYSVSGSHPDCGLSPDGQGFVAVDVDRDGDVDLVDFAAFQRCYGGPDRLAAPDCAD